MSQKKDASDCRAICVQSQAPVPSPSRGILNQLYFPHPPSVGSDLGADL